MTYGERKPDPPRSGLPDPATRPAGVPWVRDFAPGKHYEIILDGRLAGVAVYERRPGRITFTHTEVLADFKGQGMADRLATAAMDDVRARGDEKVTPRCPFMASFFGRHPEYQDLLAGPMSAYLKPDAPAPTTDEPR